MEIRQKRKSWIRYFVTVLSGACLLANANLTYAEWQYGIGAGIIRENPVGDVGFDTKIAGPVELDVKLTPENVDDLREKAYGIGGYATNGKWTITFATAQITYGDSEDYTTSDNTLIEADVSADFTNLELTIGRNVYKSRRLALGILGGLQYNSHVYSIDLEIDNSDTDRELDNSWTDALIGASVSIPISRRWIWNNTFKAGLGESNSNYFGSTGLTWRFAKHWSAACLLKYTVVEYENGEKGDSDWYLYDIDKFGYGVNLFFNW